MLIFAVRFAVLSTKQKDVATLLQDKCDLSKPSLSVSVCLSVFVFFLSLSLSVYLSLSLSFALWFCRSCVCRLS